MKPANPSICSRCGSVKASKARYVACSSTSCWRGEYNWPVLVKDDIRVWRLMLCDECLTGVYAGNLSRELKAIAWWLKWSPVWLTAGIIGVLLNSYVYVVALGATRVGDAPAGLGLIFFFVFLVCSGLALAGAIGLPIQLIRYWKKSRQLRAFKPDQPLPEEKYAEAFKGEAYRIIKELEEARPKNVWGEFPLPLFRDYDDLPVEARKFQNERTQKMLDIECVSDTEEALSRSLAPPWKLILEHKPVNEYRR